jgi:ATP synthase protein I
MVENNANEDRAGYQIPLADEVGRKARRKLRGRSEKRRPVWFGLGMFGLVGWAVAIPTLVGIGIGVWLDAHHPAGQVSWTLTFLVIGILIGCLNAWYWIKQESHRE